MTHIDLTANDLLSALLTLSETEIVCVLDSCGVGYLNSHLMIAGIDPVDVVEVSNDDPGKTLAIMEEKLSDGHACVFTISYDLGRKLYVDTEVSHDTVEPDLFLAAFDVLIVHDYATGVTRLTGNYAKFETIEAKLRSNISNLRFEISDVPTAVHSNFTKAEYLAAIEAIQERIRCGDTYQVNLTQQLTLDIPVQLTPQRAFARLRRDHPAPFASFIQRVDSTVVSASPERFFRIGSGHISTSPIKGTRPRGTTAEEDARLKNELLESEKDRAENTMIVDMLRNDIGRVCQYGSVFVEMLCELEEHPTFFHLVSTVTGEVRPIARFSDVLRAMFPCGSITGAPKINTMRMIDEIESADRGLSMGAIGYYSPERFGLPSTFDLNVAIRTLVVRDGIGKFHVGGGVTIDSDPVAEYEESLVKAQAILNAFNGTISP